VREDGLRLEFPAVSTAEWEAAIAADLKGADAAKKLLWRSEEGLTIRPYYRREDRPAAGAVLWRAGAVENWDAMEAGGVEAWRWQEQGATAVQELAFGLAEGVERLAAGAAPETLVFGFGVGSNYFFEIAKPRAARRCWAQVLRAFGLPEVPMRLHARTALANKSWLDGNTNLLRATTEALAAAIGGYDRVTVTAAGFEEELGRNVLRILEEEAHVAGVEDAARGAYYIEALTEELGRAAWALFQELEAAGGYEAAGARMAELTAASRARKEEAMAVRQRTMVGVNQYPDAGAAVLAAGEPGEGWRLAGRMEALRVRVERHVASTGRRPRVALLERGDVKMRKARAAFCVDFFGCAGIAAGGGMEGADLVVLCSSDAEYLDLAREVVGSVAVPVVVAGNPREGREELEAAGVAGFVHVRSNQPAVLGEWLDRWEVAQ
jgi:methylmalonyl-CoA mutase